MRNLGDAAPLLLRSGPIGCVVEQRIGPAARPVRAIAFDKSSTMNWSLAWHQDRTICVKEQIDTPGYRAWNRKNGAIHVEPPFDLLERMMTIRIHIDDVSNDNAPLKIALGSHRMGRVPEDSVKARVSECEQICCLAQAGDVWLYSTPILHASDRSLGVGRRRVLQLDYSADELPDLLRFEMD